MLVFRRYDVLFTRTDGQTARIVPRTRPGSTTLPIAMKYVMIFILLIVHYASTSTRPDGTSPLDDISVYRRIAAAAAAT